MHGWIKEIVDDYMKGGRMDGGVCVGERVSEQMDCSAVDMHTDREDGISAGSPDKRLAGWVCTNFSSWNDRLIIGGVTDEWIIECGTGSSQCF